MKTYILLALIISFSVKTYSQEILSSTINVETRIGDQQFVAVYNSGILFYDETKSALYLKVDFNNEEDSAVEWLKDIRDADLYFKVIIPPDFFKNTGNYNKATTSLKGQIFFNGVWQVQPVDVGITASEN